VFLTASWCIISSPFFIFLVLRGVLALVFLTQAADGGKVACAIRPRVRVPVVWGRMGTVENGGSCIYPLYAPRFLSPGAVLRSVSCRGVACCVVQIEVVSKRKFLSCFAKNSALFLVAIFLNSGRHLQ